MKKIVFALALLTAIQATKAQVPADTATLRAKINEWIVTNGSKQITAKQINQLFLGVVNLMKAYAVDSGRISHDTLFLTRRGGFADIVIKLPGSEASEVDPTVPLVVKGITSQDVTNWNAKQSQLTPGPGLVIQGGAINVKKDSAIWNANKIAGNPVSLSPPTNGQSLIWDGEKYAPADVSAGESLWQLDENGDLVNKSFDGFQIVLNKSVKIPNEILFNTPDGQIMFSGSSGAPSFAVDKSIWYDNTTGKFKIREGNVVKDMVSDGGAGDSSIFATQAQVDTGKHNIRLEIANLTSPVNPDWNAASGLAEILNKPTIPAAQINSDWDAASGISRILNKPGKATKLADGLMAKEDKQRLDSNTYFVNLGNGYMLLSPVNDTVIGVKSIKFTGATVTETDTTINIEISGGGGDVASVFGRYGEVVAQSGDYSAYYAALSHTHSFASLTGITGTPNGSKFLRDDGSWQPVSPGGDTYTFNKSLVDNSGTVSLIGDSASLHGEKAYTSSAGIRTWRPIIKADLSGIVNNDLLKYRESDSALIPFTPDYLNSSSSLSWNKIVGITGTPNGSKFLRDDGSWQSVSPGGDTYAFDNSLVDNSGTVSLIGDSTSLQGEKAYTSSAGIRTWRPIIKADLSGIANNDRLKYRASDSTFISCEPPKEGRYTPTLAPLSNIESATAGTCTFRAGDSVVTVFGNIDITVSAGGAASILTLTVPPTLSADVLTVSGFGNSNISDAPLGAIITNTSDPTKVYLQFTPPASGGITIHFSFQYILDYP